MGFEIQIYCIFAIAWISMKISLPALVTLEHQFGVSASAMKFVVLAFFVSYGASIILWGTLSDLLGRRRTLWLGFALAVTGVIVVVTSDDYWQYLIGRCIEGVGISVATPTGRALIVDVYQRKESAMVLSKAASVTGPMPGLAPIAGGYILAFMGWRAIYIVFLVMLVGVFGLCYLRLPNTHPDSSPRARDWRITERLGQHIRQYRQVMSDKRFWGYAVVYYGYSGLMLGYYGAMPFWFVSQYGYREDTYAWLGVFSVGVYLTSLMIARWLLKRMDLERLLWRSLCLSIVPIAWTLACQLLGWVNPFSIVMAMCAWATVAGLVFGCANIGAVYLHKDIAGSTSAILGSINFILVGLFSWIESHMNMHHFWNLLLLFVVVSACVITINYFSVYRGYARQQSPVITGL